MILDLRDVTANDKITGNEDLQGVFDATETALVLGLLLLSDDEMALAIHDLFVWAGDRAEIGYEVTLEDLRERANDYPALMPLWTALDAAKETSPYTLLEGASEDGRVSVALRDGDWSFSVAYAPEDDPSNANAALGQLAKQITHNLANDRMTQIMLDRSRIPAPLAALVTL